MCKLDEWMFAVYFFDYHMKSKSFSRLTGQSFCLLVSNEIKSAVAEYTKNIDKSETYDQSSSTD